MSKRQSVYTAASGSVKVPVYIRRQIKKGKTHTSYTLLDHTDGTRKLLTFADLGDAKERAKAIAEGTASGETKCLNDRDTVNDWKADIRPEILKALEAIGPTNLTILPAAQFFAQAIRILEGRSDELLTACQYWMQHRPDAPLEAKLGRDAVPAYLNRRNNISDRRRANLTAQLDWFTRDFGDVALHEVKPQAVRALMDERGWGAKTRNDFLSSVSLLCNEAQFSGWVPKVIPAVWLQPTKSAPNKLKELVRHAYRKTGIAWKDNGPRHSYGTYAPTGDYGVGRLANTGKNFWTVEPTPGLMYFGVNNGTRRRCSSAPISTRRIRTLTIRAARKSTWMAPSRSISRSSAGWRAWA